VNKPLFGGSNGSSEKRINNIENANTLWNIPLSSFFNHLIVKQKNEIIGSKRVLVEKEYVFIVA
jgi:hypothetical protein